MRKGDDGRRPSASTFFSFDDSAGGGGGGGGAGRPGPDPQGLRAFEKMGGFAAMGRQLELHVTCQAVCDALMGMIFGVWGSKHEPRPIREKDVLAIKGNKESWLRCDRDCDCDCDCDCGWCFFLFLFFYVGAVAGLLVCWSAGLLRFLIIFGAVVVLNLCCGVAYCVRVVACCDCWVIGSVAALAAFRASDGHTGWCELLAAFSRVPSSCVFFCLA